VTDARNAVIPSDSSPVSDSYVNLHSLSVTPSSVIEPPEQPETVLSLSSPNVVPALASIVPLLSDPERLTLHATLNVLSESEKVS
jgi:hypothetical protein